MLKQYQPYNPYAILDIDTTLKGLSGNDITKYEGVRDSVYLDSIRFLVLSK